MIIRPEQHWFLRLFDWHGSVLSKIIFRLLLNVLMSIIAIISYQWYEQLGIHLTVAPFSLLGIAIAIFLGFRNSASYNRFVEARNLWGTVLIAERTLMRQLKNILPTEHQTHQKIASYLIAFSWSLKHQLRKTHPGADLNRLLPPDTVAEILGSSMPTNRILLLVGHELGQLREAGKVSDITYGLMDNKLEHQTHQKIASYLIAFSWSLKHQLRKTHPGADLNRLLPPDTVAEILGSSMPTNRILLLVGHELGQLREAGKVSDITYGLMDNKLDELAHVLGGCERLASTPVPFAYTLILQRTVYLFCTLLPFALVGDLHYMTPFVSVFISYTFLSWDSLAEELEDPFGTAANDLPLNAMCNTIERNLLDMTGQHPLPETLQPDRYYNLT